MRYITHNWADKYASKILSRLRAAAQPGTKLVVIDIIADHMSRDTGIAASIPGAEKLQAPEPLLPYADAATSLTYSMDICVCVFQCTLHARRADVQHADDGPC